ncbi:MAG: hypothetical protein IJ576_09345 [Synergistaceae bacterium]|nr:hypothetical protein [Synergistaceae bacterium]
MIILVMLVSYRGMGSTNWPAKFRPVYNSQRCRSCGLKGICRRSEFLCETLLDELDELEGNSDSNNESESAAD